MGMLIDGSWTTERHFPTSKSGAFQRASSVFRGWVTADGAPSPLAPDAPAFPAAAGRYHLYVAMACPWAHRTLIFRALKGLEAMISVSVVNPFMGDEGWTFEPGDSVIPDPLFGAQRLHEIYTRADDRYTGRVTVPVLWDKETGTIVSNESAEIIRMLNSAFDGLGARPGDYYPEALRAEIDAVNERIYATLNNGVYRCGFATSQSAYDAAVAELFDTLDWIEDRLSAQRYLVGGQLTEADLRLFPTILRFDPVYHTHFKCNKRQITQYSNLWGWLRDLHQLPGMASTINMDATRRHYFESHESINPHRIIPPGPTLDYAAPHGRDAL